jgi:hypothetical protein
VTQALEELARQGSSSSSLSPDVTQSPEAQLHVLADCTMKGTWCLQLTPLLLPLALLLLLLLLLLRLTGSARLLP